MFFRLDQGAKRTITRHRSFITPRPPADSAGHAPRHSAISLLVVSLDEHDGLALGQILDRNCQLHRAASRREAVSLVRRYRPKVVICDQVLADGDWRDLLDELQREKGSAPTDRVVAPGRRPPVGGSSEPRRIRLADETLHPDRGHASRQDGGPSQWERWHELAAQPFDRRHDRKVVAGHAATGTSSLRDLRPGSALQHPNTTQDTLRSDSPHDGLRFWVSSIHRNTHTELVCDGASTGSSLSLMPGVTGRGLQQQNDPNENEATVDITDKAMSVQAAVDCPT